MKLGIVGLPNVGKSTLFNALVKNAKAEASNYPFCTIDPNVGVVEVPDERLAKLAQISNSKKIVPATVDFTDIAGLVSGAHKGEGLGNQFLSHIRETDAIAMVVRFFENKDIIHVAGAIDPVDDIHTINLELILADLSVVEKRLPALEKEIRANKPDAKEHLAVLEKCKATLDKAIPLRNILSELSELQYKILTTNYQLLTTKPVIYIANVAEDQAAITSEELVKHYGLQSLLKQTTDNKQLTTIIPISAKIESELAELSKDEQKEYLNELGLQQSGLKRLIQAAYSTLGLITYLTSGEPETRAWTISKGDTAPVAAGKIHKDFEKGFIAADVIKYDNFIENKGWQACKEKGLIKTEGKTYIVQDGDVMLFKFNV